ncbi:MAG: GWxTD domain-containing protein [Candidatus Hydrothermia bacterium]|nr:GWxTD domain-containing protein [Candidatus Hydrothermae bacterium]
MRLILLLLLGVYTSRKDDILVYTLPEEGSDSVEFLVYVNFNRQNLVFFKEEEHYRSTVELQMEVFGDRNALLYGNYWNFELITSTYRETKEISWYQRFYTFKVGPAKQYKVRCRLKDKEGRLLASLEKKISPPVNISDPILLDSTALAVGEKRPAPRYVRSPKAVFYVKSVLDSIPFKLELVAIKPLVKENGILRRGDNYIELNLENINSGSYKVVLTSMNEIRETELVLFSLPLDLTSGEFNEILQVLSYFVPSSELDSFKLYKENPDSLRDYWKRFWKRRDPTPETDLNEFEQDFWSKVEYADENFTTHFKRGMVSDRGLCYIVLGPPDEIERHPFDLEVPAYEVWYYYEKNYAFIFMDLKGVGEYEIVDPPRHSFYEILRRR